MKFTKPRTFMTRLSQKLANLLWCFAGTPEEDEFAGQSYLDMYQHEHEKFLMEEGDSEDSQEEDGDVDGNNEESNSDENSDDEDVVMHEVSNTLGGSDDDQEEEGDEEDEDEDMEELDDSEVPHCRGAHLASLFVRTFFRTVHREWGRMDKYRIDKFYTLSRYMVAEIMEYMALRHWNLGILRLFNDAIYQEVLSLTPNGLRFHLIDITLDELAKVNATKAPMPLTEATFLDCLEPYFAMAQSAPDAVVQARVVENVLEKFLNEYSVVGDRAQNKDDEEAAKLVMDEVHVGTVAEFIFDVASDGDTRDLYRKGLYDLHKAYIRRLKQVGKDVEIDRDHGDHEDDHDHGHEHDHEDHGEEEEATSNEVTTEQTSGKKKKKKKNKKEKKDPAEESPLTKAEAAASVEREDTKQGKKKRKKKKSDKKQDEPAQDAEEEVTISVKDQKTAKAALKAKKADEESGGKKKRKKESLDADSDVGDSGKRVKFGNQNRARSWKASMKGLRTMESPVTDVTPNKGILLNKGAKPASKSNKKAKRKKATDYF